MIKSALVRRIFMQNPHLRLVDVEKIVDAIFDKVVLSMARGRRVEVRGFGTFSVKVREAHSSRNPKTGAAVAVRKKVVPFFRMGKELKSRLNRDLGPPGPRRPAG